MKEVVVERHSKDAVNLLSQVDLSHLELVQIVEHHGVLHIGVHSVLE